MFIFDAGVAGCGLVAYERELRELVPVLDGDQHMEKCIPLLHML